MPDEVPRHSGMFSRNVSNGDAVFLYRYEHATIPLISNAQK